MRPILLIIILLLCAWAGQAQTPGINYQGIARDPDGKPISQKGISIRISIVKDNADGDAEYTEVHSVTTNSFGLFTLVIGGGNVQSGDFQLITWAVGNKWLKVEMDPDGGNAFNLMGSQQLMSVPYAFYSKYAGNAPSVTQDLSLTGNKLKVTNNPAATNIDLAPYLDDTDKQDLTLAGNTLSLTNDATAVDLAAYNQDLKLAGNTLGLVNAPTTVDLAPYNQDLKLTGNTLGLVNAPTTVDLTPYKQDLTLTGNTLSLTNDATAVDLAPYNQDLKLTGNTLGLVNAPTTVDLTPYKQDLKLTGNTLGLQNAPTTVDLLPYLDNTDNQTISNVLTQGNDAGGQKITNLGTPTANSDAATKQYIDNKIAANYAFKADYAYSQALSIGNDVTLPLTDSFDDFSVVTSTNFTASVAGTYLFVLDGSISNIFGGPSISLLYNGTKYPVAVSSTNNRYNSTYMFKLTAGQSVSVVADGLGIGYTITGSFYGYKLL